MQIDPDAPGRKSVFKINTDKLAYSRNCPEACLHCHRKRGDGEKPLPLCNGCLRVRFCNREHQVAGWPQHKVFCKQQAQIRQNYEEAEKIHSYKPLGLPSLQEQLRLVEDWAEIHRFTLAEAMAWAFSISHPPLDFRSQYFHFRLKFRPESEGNPSTSFSLVGAEVVPIRGCPLAHLIATKMPYLESVDAEERAAGTTGFLGMFTCLYQIDNTQAWISTSEIYDGDIPSHRPNKPWFWFPKYCIDLGLAFRIVGPHTNLNSRKPGFMERKGKKWVWEEYST
ncbi:hypothetical protein B0H11DRAFT_485303 [Mycena galericulata]|nr:hypothetical protein B0H11DRAFT_485303 [Mycena galericulata]